MKSQHQPLNSTPMLPQSVEMTHRIVNDVQVTSDPVWLRRHGAVRTKNGWMVPLFTDLRPFVEMIKGANVVTIDSLFEIADNVYHDMRRISAIALAHTQCSTDDLSQSVVTPGMPHHVSCNCTVCKSTEQSNKLQVYAESLLACFHACAASLLTHMIKANIEPACKVVLSQCTSSTCAHYGHQLAVEPELVSVHPMCCKLCTCAPAWPETDLPVDEFNQPIDKAFMADEVAANLSAQPYPGPPAFVTRGGISYKHMSALIDPGCTTFATGSLDSFEGAKPTEQLMRIADKKEVHMDFEGVMCCAVFDSDNNFITLRINDAVQATGFSTLLSSGVFEDRDIK